MVDLYSKEENYCRQLSENTCNYRPPFWRDYARLIHSPSFRRLQSKTQLFPSYESDFFRNRLTHSLEVAQIAKTIAIKLNYEYQTNIDLDLVSFAGLAHDLGHPPFGHNGEKALNNCMVCCGGFEGNAQTLRLLSVLEKKMREALDPTVSIGDEEYINYMQGIGPQGTDLRLGLNLTSRTLASILKYDNEIICDSGSGKASEKSNSEIDVVKGYYCSNKELVDKIKEDVLLDIGHLSKYKFKTIECQIMDIADDIAYSTYDLEDCLKAGFISLMDLNVEGEVLHTISDKVIKSLEKENVKITIDEVQNILNEKSSSTAKAVISASQQEEDSNTEEEHIPLGIETYFGVYNANRGLQENGYLRTAYTSEMVNKAVESISFVFNSNEPALSMIQIPEDIRKTIEVLKQYNFVTTIESSKLKIIEHRGKEIIESIFKVLEREPMLMPKDWYSLYNLMQDERSKKRVICDFISGMTDRYAIEYYCRFNSVNPESIFKPF